MTVENLAGPADTGNVTDDREAVRRRTRWQYWALLIGWYGPAAALAAVVGWSGEAPLIPCLLLFGVLEFVTVVFSATIDDWGDDFRGDRDVLIRGTLANVVVVAAAVGFGSLWH